MTPLVVTPSVSTRRAKAFPLLGQRRVVPGDHRNLTHRLARYRDLTGAPPITLHPPGIRGLTRGVVPDPGVRVRSLLTLLYPVVVLFALTYYVIAHANPAQFEGIATRTDSLYYTVVTLGTVGYGDVHAVGQLAKWVTIIQVAFDLVVIGALIAVASSRFQIVPTPPPKSSPERPAE